MSTIPNRYNYTSDALDDLAYAVEDREWGKVQEAHANIIRDLTPEAMGIPELDGDRYHNPDYSEQQDIRDALAHLCQSILDVARDYELERDAALIAESQ